MAFVAATYAEVPELSLANIGELQDHYLRVMNLDLPGFIVRQVSDDPDVAHAVLKGALKEVVWYAQTDDRYNFTLDGPNGYYDLWLHIDWDKAVSPVIQVNETTLRYGAMGVDIFNLKQPYADQRRRDQRVGEIDVRAINMYSEESRVDDQYIDPNGFRGQLTPRDMFIFSDTLSPHTFRTTLKPRRASTGSLYRPRRANMVSR